MLRSPMGGQTSGREAVPPPRTNQRTFLEDVVLTFSSPMAWLLVVALIITWLGVAIVLFDLLDYKTLTDYTSYCDDPVCLSPDNVRGRRTGLPPPPAIARRSLKTQVKPRSAGIHGDVTTQESGDWLEMIWAFVAGLVAPDEEEEGIHHLTETLTSFHSEEL